MKIKVKEFLGTKLKNEDAIVLRSMIGGNLSKKIELDFYGIEKVSTTFLTCLFNDLINKKGREFIIDKINVKNLSNKSDYSRVVRGTTF